MGIGNIAAFTLTTAASALIGKIQSRPTRNPTATFTAVAPADADPFLFTLCPTAPLPEIDLSKTLAQQFLSDHWHRKSLRFARNHFHRHVWCFRFGISCFVGLLFVGDGPFRDVFLALMLLAYQLLVTTAMFLSLDILRLLVRSYDFWFLTIINALNWIAFAAVLGDKRAMASLVGGFAAQIAIAVDASFRTFRTSVNSMKLGIPVVLVLFGFVSLRAIDGAHFFDVAIDGRHIYDAADIMGFTAFTLAIMQAKILFLKKRHVTAPIGGSGFLNIPCAFIKVTLRLDAVAASRGNTVNSPGCVVPRANHHSSQTPEALAVHCQRLKLSPLPMRLIDARQTLLPSRYWLLPPAWVFRWVSFLRVLLYCTGGVGFSLSVLLVVRRIQSYVQASRLDEARVCPGSLLTSTDWILTQIAASFSITFCGVFALFYQRDLLRLLATRNFDYVFSIAQVAAFCSCIVDMTCWERCSTLATLSWAIWLVWALSTDALTPLVKRSMLGLPRRLPAIVLATVLLNGLGITYVVLFLDNNGLRYRTIVHFATSSAHSFALTTRTVMLGRAATISLWCTRQVVTLYTRRQDELHLIRGLVELESPFGLFPAKINRHSPALTDLI